MNKILSALAATTIAASPFLAPFLAPKPAFACTWLERLDPTNPDCHIIEGSGTTNSTIPSKPSQPKPEDLYSRANVWVNEGYSCLEVQEYPLVLCRRFPRAKLDISINDRRIQSTEKPDFVRKCVDDGNVALFKISANYLYCVDSTYR